MLSSVFSARNKSHYPYLPIDLVIVRNGASDGSIVIHERRRKTELDLKDYKKKLAKVHNSKWRLTKFGQLQAKIAGKWIVENFPNRFNAYLTGEYVRSLETAALLNLEGAKWIPSIYLRPRSFGSFSELDRRFSEAEFEQAMKEKSRDSFYWTPPNGESIAHLTLRTERVIHWIRNRVPETGAVIIVTHKDVMECIRIRMERISQMEYMSKISQPPQYNKLHYCSILQYTRRNPFTNEVVPYYEWMRILTPWLGKHSMPTKFQKIARQHYGNAELMAEVSNVPHIL